MSLRDLARRLGMAPASLYSYIDSKNGLYDAMFAQGYRALLAKEPPAHSDDLRTYSALNAAIEVTQEDLDLVSAIVSGLISQQISNDPGGTRWPRLLDDAVDLLVPRLEPRRKQPAPAGGRQTRKKDPA